MNKKGVSAILIAFVTLSTISNLTIIPATRASPLITPFFDDLAGFNSAAGSSAVVMDFDDIPHDTDITGLTIHGMTFDAGPAPSAPLIVVRGTDTYTPPGFDWHGPDNKLFATTGENVLSPGGVELSPGPNPMLENDDLTLTLSTPVSAVGFDILYQSLDGNSYTAVTLLDASDNVLYDNGFIPIPGDWYWPGGSTFVGFVSDLNNIAKIIIDEYDDNNVNPDSNIGFDTIRLSITVNLGIVPVNTADENIFFSEVYYGGIGQKLQEYYREVSYGYLNVKVDVYHPDGSYVSVPETTSWYSWRDEGVFLRDAIEASDDAVDFTEYDNVDENGIGLVVFVPPSDIWGLGAFIMSERGPGGLYDTDDNTRIDAIYVHEPRFRSNRAIIRGLAHEFAHGLGKLLVTRVAGNSKDCSWVLPDLYLRGNVKQCWALMGRLEDYDEERVHFSSYSKEWLGWLEYKDTEIGESHTLKSLVTLGFAEDVLRYNYEQNSHFYILELRTNSTDKSEWDTETIHQKVVAFYKVDVRSDDLRCQADTVNLVHTLTEAGKFYDADAGVEFNVESLTEETAEVSIERPWLERLKGAILDSLADILSQILPILPHEPIELIPLPDIDLHAYSDDGKHVGMNYETGEYEIEIPGTITSGDLVNGREWIFVPEDLSVYFVVSAKDNAEFLKHFPEADGIETYTMSIVYYDPNEIRYESSPVSQEIMPDEEITHRCAIIQNPDGTYTPVIDDTPPLLTVETPLEDEALQDGVTLTASAWDENGVSSVTFSIREPNGEQGTIISPEFEYMPAVLLPSGKWELAFDTLQLPDGYYLAFVEAIDLAGNKAFEVVPFSIRNWACLELLPATQANKAGRTMPVKFSLRVFENVDPAKPFVHNEELTIVIYEKGDPDNILQTSTYGDTAKDYRIDSIGELYITNFRTLKKKLTTYVVEIYRKDMLIGSFTFETVK